MYVYLYWFICKYTCMNIYTYMHVHRQLRVVAFWLNLKRRVFFCHVFTKLFSSIMFGTPWEVPALESQIKSDEEENCVESEIPIILLANTHTITSKFTIAWADFEHDLKIRKPVGNPGLMIRLSIIQANHCGYPPEGSDVEYEPCNAWLPSVCFFWVPAPLFNSCFWFP